MGNGYSFTFTWRVENYTRGSLEVSSYISSPNFVARNVSDCEWHLNLYPEYGNEGWISCSLWSNGHQNLKLINYKLEICDKDENIQYSQQFIHKSAGFHNASGAENTIQLTRFCDAMNKATFIVRVKFINNENSYSLKECVVKYNFISNNYTFKWNINCHQRKFDKTSFLCDDVMYEAVFDRRRQDFQIIATSVLKKDYRVIYKLFWRDTDGTLKLYQSMTRAFNNWRETLQFPCTFIESSQLFFKDRPKLKDDFVIITVEFLPLGHLSAENLECNESNQMQAIAKHNHPTSYAESNSLPLPTKSFNDALPAMYANKIFSDVEFRIGKKVFSAHRGVLASHSSVFQAMFNQDMAEKKSGVVEIADVDPVIFDMFLQYFYSGKVDNMDIEKASELLLLSDKYDVSLLLAKCVDFLASNISTETALDVLQTAEAIHQTRLKNAAVSYIKTHASTILKSDQWKQFLASNAGLATEILAQLTEDLNVSFRK